MDWARAGITWRGAMQRRPCSVLVLCEHDNTGWLAGTGMAIAGAGSRADRRLELLNAPQDVCGHDPHSQV